MKLANHSALAAAAVIGLSAPLALATLRQGGGSQAFVASIPTAAAIRPQDIVNLNVSSAVIDPAGVSLVIYTVPNDRWLVVRDFEISWFTGVGGGVPFLIEDLSGTETVKRMVFIDSPVHSSLGLVFQPGSDVVLKETSFAGLTVSYALNAYLAAP